MRIRWTLILLLVCLPVPGAAQLDIDGYALGVGSYAAESDFLEAGNAGFARGRIMLGWATSWFSADAAYEHLLLRQSATGALGSTNPGSGSLTSTDWLPLDWTVRDSNQSEWRHRIDRLQVRATAGPIEVTVGRQAISWATALFLTPSDPFAPFDPSDPFREYRGGVDALRVRGFAGPFTEIEAVVRPTDTPLGTTMTALARVGTSRGGWAFGGWGGVLHDEAAAALFLNGAIGSSSLRAEFALREDPEGGALPRASLGIDRFKIVRGRDLFMLAEVQYDGYGSDSADELLRVAASAPYARGEMQTLGRWTVATQASYQLHPLVGVDALLLLNADDASGLIAPGISWSTTGSASTRLGLYRSFGDGPPAPLMLGSEYGSVPTSAYVSVSLFF
jgi:hypothetical protein